MLYLLMISQQFLPLPSFPTWYLPPRGVFVPGAESTMRQDASTARNYLKAQKRRQAKQERYRTQSWTNIHLLFCWVMDFAKTTGTNPSFLKVFFSSVNNLFFPRKAWNLRTRRGDKFHFVDTHASWKLVENGGSQPTTHNNPSERLASQRCQSGMHNYLNCPSRQLPDLEPMFRPILSFWFDIFIHVITRLKLNMNPYVPEDVFFAQWIPISKSAVAAVYGLVNPWIFCSPKKCILWRSVENEWPAILSWGYNHVARSCHIDIRYTLWWTNIAVENHHF